jgi:hypothetical protein
MPLERLSAALALRFVASAAPVSSDRITHDVGFEAARKSASARQAVMAGLSHIPMDGH